MVLLHPQRLGNHDEGDRADRSFPDRGVFGIGLNDRSDCEFMNQDDYNVIKLFEKPGISFVWDGSKYRLRK